MDVFRRFLYHKVNQGKASAEEMYAPMLAAAGEHRHLVRIKEMFEFRVAVGE